MQEGHGERPLRADNETRTRDLNLGKVALYQLSYVRTPFPPAGAGGKCEQNTSRWVPGRQNRVRRTRVPRARPTGQRTA